MKYLLIVIPAVLFVLNDGAAAPGSPGNIKSAPATATDAPSPLAVFDKSWNNPEYASCNTAADASFMSDKEKELIYILNLARRYPAQFANTVVKQYPAWSHNTGMAKTDHYQSLLRTMRLLPQSTLLYPDHACYASAQCHAVAAGKKGYIGHNRLNADCKKQQHFMGECCDYGHDEPIDILMALLVDEGVANLGHRLICFTTYNKIGVSMAPHREYGNSVVLDFYY